MDWKCAQYRNKYFSEKKSHNQMTIEFMRLYGSITQAEAYEAFGCWRLSGRINDLRKAGYNIVTKINDGDKKYAIYTLIEEKE